MAVCTPNVPLGRLVNVTIAADDAPPYAQRSVLIYVPKGDLSKRRPAIVTLHGFGSNPMENLQLTGLAGDSIAREYGWVIAAPYGSAPGLPTGCSDPQAPCAWNAGGWSTAASANHSDVAFLSRVAKWLQDHACARPDGIFATGFSAGGMMANRLACEAPGNFRGVAPMGGSVVLGDGFRACAPRPTVHGWLSFCGSKDGVCTKAEYGSLGQNASFALFGKSANCSRIRPTYSTQTTRCEAYAECGRDGATPPLIERCIIIGLGHEISGHGRAHQPATNVDAVRYALNRLSLTLPTSIDAGDVGDKSHDEGNNTLTLRLLTDAHSVQLGATCLDGSPAGYYWRRGVGPNASRFILSLVGAGWCTDLASCKARSKTPIGSSLGWSKVVHGFGLANTSSKQNPFVGWSVAYVNSCDGALFLGNTTTSTARGSLHFRGRAILDAVIAQLVRTDGLGQARDLLLTGDSSGGVAAALSIDRVAAALPAVPRVRGLIDAAFFLDRPGCGGDRASLAPIMALAAINVSGCGSEWQCASLPHVLPTIARPLFLSQSIYDYSQLGSSGEALGCTPPGTTTSSSLPACDAAGMRRFGAFGDAMRAQLRAALRGARPQARGAFGIGCIAHSLTEYGRFLDGKELPLYDNPEWQVPARSGRTVARAVAEWYEGNANESVHIDEGEWPENSPCAWLGLP